MEPYPNISDTPNAQNTHDLSGTVKALDSFETALNALSTRVIGLERKGFTNSNASTDVLSRIEKTVSLTEKLDRDMETMQQQMQEVKEQVKALRMGNGERQGTEGDKKECRKSELEVLDINQVRILNWDCTSDLRRIVNEILHQPLPSFEIQISLSDTEVHLCKLKFSNEHDIFQL